MHVYRLLSSMQVWAWVEDHTRSHVACIRLADKITLALLTHTVHILPLALTVTSSHDIHQKLSTVQHRAASTDKHVWFDSRKAIIPSQPFAKSKTEKMAAVIGISLPVHITASHVI